METTNQTEPETLTLVPTEAPSASISLPDGCLASQRGLTLPEGLPYDEWMKIGTKLSALNGSVMWLLGDWLAYGHRSYQKEKWGGRVPNGLYERISFETGYSPNTLKNAKFLCAHLEPSCRQENLTFTHAQEIVALAPKNEIKKWIDKVVTEKLTVKAMREQLRREKATFQPESNDDGTTSVLETTRQFVRDFLTQSDNLNPKLCVELKRVLLPVLGKLG